MPLRKIRQLSNFNQFFMSSCTTFTLCCVPLGNSSYAYSNWKSEKKLNVDWSNRCVCVRVCVCMCVCVCVCVCV